MGDGRKGEEEVHSGICFLLFFFFLKKHHKLSGSCKNGTEGEGYLLLSFPVASVEDRGGFGQVCVD